MNEGQPQKEAQPLLHWLLRKYPGTPKTRAKQWITAGRVSVGGTIVRKPHQLMPDPAGDLRLLDRHATTLDCGAGWQIHPRVSLLYLDSALAIVNKGPGLISVPGGGEDLSALSILADFLAGRMKALEDGDAGKTLPPAYRQLDPLPVHRLDQYTSGVFCMALHPIARSHLIEQVRAHTMKREYLAFVEGQLPEAKGEWRDRLKLTVDELRQLVIIPEDEEAYAEAQEAVTHYEVADEYRLKHKGGFVTKLRLSIETGLKHQIRAQAASHGVPLIGDRTYNAHYREMPRGLEVGPAPAIPFDRQALHAESLTLEHPQRPGELLSWQAELPKDLRQLESALRAGAY